MTLPRLLQALEDAVVPLRCAFCGTRSRDGEGSVCVDCRDDLPWVEPERTVLPLCVSLAPLAYEFPIDAAIKALKFSRRLWYGPALAQLLDGALEFLPADIDAVLPVPLHWQRKWRRGFNQAREIGRPVARRLGVPLIGGVRRARATRPQTGLSAAERRRNVQGSFVALRPCQSRHVLIVDDVVTTGATIGQLARVVLESGADRVSSLAVARA